MNTTTSIAANAINTGAAGQNDHQSTLKFITCGSVDDDKSTLIGRLLVDSRSVLQEPIAARPFALSRVLGALVLVALVLVDTATHKTAGAALIH
jgi:sulfate adenylyltransferase subunit 1 (EFTu-like GTPase family)